MYFMDDMNVIKKTYEYIRFSSPLTTQDHKHTATDLRNLILRRICPHFIEILHVFLSLNIIEKNLNLYPQLSIGISICKKNCSSCPQRTLRTSGGSCKFFCFARAITAQNHLSI
jgi:hypothetical protein